MCQTLERDQGSRFPHVHAASNWGACKCESDCTITSKDQARLTIEGAWKLGQPSWEVVYLKGQDQRRSWLSEGLISWLRGREDRWGGEGEGTSPYGNKQTQS